VSDRRAYCYWIGKPMPWIRHQALASFKRHHPDWTLTIATTAPDLVEGSAADDVLIVRPNEALPHCINSDMWLGALRAAGSTRHRRSVAGIDRLKYEAPEGPATRLRPRTAWTAVSCGVIAARPGSAVMSAFLEESRSMIARDEKGWHDNLAALAAARAMRNRPGLRLGNFPAQFLYPFSPLQNDQRRWWNPKERLPAMPLLAAHIP
jgi:hypothetical protein